MLGLRPRLVTRPSLIDLLANKDTDLTRSLTPPIDDEDTQGPLSTELPPSPVKEQDHSSMAQQNDEEQQYGM